MADTILAKAQAVALLQKLSTDDQFRASYLANPRAALTSAGIPGNVVNEVPQGPLNKLADKSVFAAALAQVQADMADVCTCQVPPQIRFRFGS